MAPNKRSFGDITREDRPDAAEYLFKILVIGDLATGKTSFIRRYVHQMFNPNYRATIGVDFALKVLHWNSNSIVRLQLWDIAGQERFGCMTRVYYKDAIGAFICFDVTKMQTFDAVIKWKEDLDEKVSLIDGSNIPCVLIANKCDLPKQESFNSPAFLDRFCDEHGFVGWFFTSSKDNLNIDEAATLLVSEILQRSKTSFPCEEKEKTLSSLEIQQNKKSCVC